MNIEFHKIIIDGFMSIGHMEINLKDNGYVLVQGVNNNTQDLAKSNGSGKSSMWEALVWCLTGSTIRGSKTVENINQTSGCLVETHFRIDVNEFIVIRTKNHSEYKTNLFVYVNDKDISGKGIRDTEKILKEYLGELDSEVIGSVIVLGQGLPSRFTNNSPSGRKEVLESLSKSDYMIQDLRTRIQNRKTQLETTIRQLEDTQLKINSSITVLNQQIINDETSLNNLDSKEEYEKQLNDLNVQRDQINLELNVLQQQLQNVQTQLSDYKEDLYKNKLSVEQQKRDISVQYTPQLDELLVQITSLGVQLTQVQNEIKQVKNIKDICPTCGQKLPNVFKPDITQQKKKKKQLLENIEFLQQQKQNVNSEMVKNLTNLDDAYKNYSQKVVQSISELESKEHQLTNETSTKEILISQLITNIQNVQNSIGSIDAVTNSLTQNICKNKEQVKNLTIELQQNSQQLELWKSHNDIIKKFDSIIKRDFRGCLLNNVINCINSKVQEYCLDVFDNTQLQFVQEGNNISISYCGKEYEMLSGGERQKIDLIVQFAIRDMLCQYLNFSCNILVLDEIFDNLDAIGCDKVIELISNKLSNISSVYIISHHAEELNIPTDNYLTVVKDSNGITRLKI